MGNHIVSRWGNKLFKTADGGYAYGASYDHNPDCYECLFFAKYRHNGVLDFVRYFEAPDTTALLFAINNLLQLDDGGYFLFSFYLTEDGQNIPHLIRTDAQGNELWSRDYAAGGDTSVNILDVLQLSSNKFVASGSKYQYAPGYELIFVMPNIIVLDSLGIILREVLGDTDSLTSAHIVATNDGGIIQTIQKVTKFDPLYSIGGIRKLDSNFTEEWVRYIDFPPIYGGTRYMDVLQTSDGQYVASGARGVAGTGKPAMHLKIKEDGTVLWERFDFSHYGNAIGLKTRARASGVLSSGSIVSVGSASITEPNGYSEKGWLIKISPGGCVADTDTLDCWAGATAPTAIKAPPIDDVQVYPNPAVDELTVVLPSSQYKETTLYFYDVTGRFLRKRTLREGRNRLIISDLPEGMIFYSIIARQGIVKTGKLIKN